MFKFMLDLLRRLILCAFIILMMLALTFGLERLDSWALKHSVGRGCEVPIQGKGN